MIRQCLPTDPSLHEDWVLWVELWLHAVRHSELRPVAEELYARLHAWFADEIAAGIADGEFDRCDPDEVADRTLAMIDGLGIRNLIGDSTISLAARAADGRGDARARPRAGRAARGGDPRARSAEVTQRRARAASSAETRDRRG